MLGVWSVVENKEDGENTQTDTGEDSYGICSGFKSGKLCLCFLFVCLFYHGTYGKHCWALSHSTPFAELQIKMQIMSNNNKKRERNQATIITLLKWIGENMHWCMTTPSQTLLLGYKATLWATACREELHIPTLLHGADDKRQIIWTECKVWFGRLEETQSTDRWSVLVLNQTESLSSATLAATNPLRHFSKPKC